jgi:hypothetical protein
VQDQKDELTARTDEHIQRVSDFRVRFEAARAAVQQSVGRRLGTVLRLALPALLSSSKIAFEFKGVHHNALLDRKSFQSLAYLRS